jgi:hypothetical protein
MKEAKIHTSFGEISFTFQNGDELEAALRELELQVKAIQVVASEVAPPPPRVPKPGYEMFYRFSPNGSVEILHMPKQRNVAAALVLFAYHPDLVSAAEIERATGIKNVASRVLSLTQNEEDFSKVGDKYGLTFVGYHMVTEKLNKLIVSAEQGEREPEEAEEEPVQ